MSPFSIGRHALRNFRSPKCEGKQRGGFASWRLCQFHPRGTITKRPALHSQELSMSLDWSQRQIERQGQQSGDAPLFADPRAAITEWLRKSAVLPQNLHDFPSVQCMTGSNCVKKISPAATPRSCGMVSGAMAPDQEQTLFRRQLCH